MKDLIIPIQLENSINLANINTNFKGIIIGYKDNNALGTIIYDQSIEMWTFVRGISTDLYSASGDFLTDVIDILIKNKTCNSFKVIEFDDKNN